MLVNGWTGEEKNKRFKIDGLLNRWIEGRG